MSKVIGFISGNWQTLALIYVIGAAVTFIGVFLFFWWICKAEDEEQELYGDEYYYPEDIDGAGTAATMAIALFVAVGCALLWVAIPLLFIGVWAYAKITEQFPELMGHMADDFDDEEKEEIQ